MENKPTVFEILRTNTNEELVDFLEQALAEYNAECKESEEDSNLELIDLLYDTSTSGELIDEKITTIVSEINGRFFGYSVYYEEFNSDFLLELVAEKGIKEIFKQ